MRPNVGITIDQPNSVMSPLYSLYPMFHKCHSNSSVSPRLSIYINEHATHIYIYINTQNQIWMHFNHMPILNLVYVIFQKMCILIHFGLLGKIAFFWTLRGSVQFSYRIVQAVAYPGIFSWDANHIECLFDQERW